MTQVKRALHLSERGRRDAKRHMWPSAVGCVVIATMGLSLVAAPQAFAQRLYTGREIPTTGERGQTGCLGPLAIGATENVWCVNQGSDGGEVQEFEAYPSQAQIPLNWDPEGSPGGFVLGGFNSVSINNSTGDIYVAGSGESRAVHVYTEAGRFKEQWELPKASSAAVDNSGGPTQGDVLVMQSEVHGAFSDAYIEAFNSEGKPVEFSSEEEYVEGNKLTGTIFGKFPEAGSMATDSSGDIYVTNGNLVDEFEPSGTFIHQFTGSEVPGGFRFLGSLAVDPTNGNLLVVAGKEVSFEHFEDVIDEFTSAGKFVEQIEGTSPTTRFLNLRAIAVNSKGYLYAVDGGEEGTTNVELIHAGTYIFGPAPQEGPKISYEPVTEPGQHSGTVNAHLEPQAGEAITSCHFEYGTNNKFELGKPPCTPDPASEPPHSYFSEPTDVSVHISGLTPETPYHYRVVLTTERGTEEFDGNEKTYTPHFVAGLETGSATNVTPSCETLNGSFIGNGEETRYYFEYGLGPSYGHKTAEVSAGEPAGPTEVHAEVCGLNPVTVYHFRLVATNGAGTSRAGDRQAETLPSPPTISGEVATAVHSDTAVLHTLINPGGGHTSYHFEYGPAPCSSEPDPCSSTPEVEIGTGFADLSAQVKVGGLDATTTYHWRVVAKNITTTTDGEEETFNTFPEIAIVNDPCPNAHVRQQTGAAFLLDCRAYELVSAANTGGYDVESNLVAGQTPYGGYPEAENPSRVLYGVNDGGIPGTDHPTNKGVDPYVATRGKEGWSTQYVGIPADNPFSILPFSSTPSGADASLGTFAFGGPGGCSPCFGPGGIETGIPVRLPNGELTQGMVAAPGFEPGSEAKPDGYIAQDLSANGEHFIFGSTSPFAQGGNDSTGPVSIYDRNLSSGETQVVSNAPAGGPLPCLQNTAQGECHAPKDSNGISELDISADGTHILLGQKVSEDADHNVYYRLYMDINDSPATIELTPGASDGVLFNGMTSDGSEVFFTTKDKLTTATNQDTDESADLYQAEVSEVGATLTRISTGTEGTGNTDACEAVSNKNGAHWNSLEATANCGVAAIGGGGGVAAKSGAVYFLSPELLDGSANGVQNQPNLYLAAPGQSPRFIATLSPEDPLVIDSLKEAGTRHSADFQLTPNGEFAVLTSILSLTGYANSSHAEVFRYGAGEEKLACASCDPTNAEAAGDASLAQNGLSLSESGQVFFNSTDALVPHALNEAEDVYEWEPSGTGNCNSESPNYSKASTTCTALISTGISPFGSSLLSASANGTDVYFFTRDVLVPQDQNGELVKIYDARAQGGFPYIEPPTLCKASDECHGPSSPAPPEPNIASTSGSPEGLRDQEHPAHCLQAGPGQKARPLPPQVQASQTPPASQPPQTRR